MNRKNINSILLFGIVVSSGITLNQTEGKAVIRKALSNITGGIRSVIGRGRNYSRSNGLSRISSESKIGESNSNIGAIRSEKYTLKGMYGTYGADIHDFDQPDGPVLKNRWYLQYTDYDGNDTTLVSLIRPKVVSSSNGIETDEYIDVNKQTQRVVHNGVGNWIKGNVIVGELEHREISKLIEQSSDFGDLEISSASVITTKDPLYAEIKYLNRFGTSKSNKGALRTNPINSLDNIYGKKLKEVDLNAIEGKINTNWWYLQYEDESGHLKTIVSNERPVVKNINGNEVEVYRDPITNDNKKLKPGMIGLWYTGQSILEQAQR